MSRLIDADALKARVAEETKIAEGLGVEMAVLAQTMRDCIYEELENSPTIKAEPVRRGRWIDHGSYVTCSECNEEQYGIDTGRFYCQNCGARMESENGND